MGREEALKLNHVLRLLFGLYTGGLPHNDAAEGAGRGSMRFPAVVQGAEALALDYGQLWIRIPPE